MAERKGKIAGIDFGTVQLGIAISDPEQRISMPLETYVRRNLEADGEYFRHLVDEHDIVMFVVGLPLHADGAESQLSQQARQFAQWLQDATGKPVELFDERFTTQFATGMMQAAGLKKKRQQRTVDKVAAQRILATYLAHRQARENS